MFVLGMEGSEKKCGPPQDNFWNSPQRYDLLYALSRVNTADNLACAVFTASTGGDVLNLGGKLVLMCWASSCAAKEYCPSWPRPSGKWPQ